MRDNLDLREEGSQPEGAVLHGRDHERDEEWEVAEPEVIVEGPSTLDVEDSFKFLKTCLGWEEVQVLDWQALRTLVALGGVAAGFLYGLGVSWDWAEVQLLAKLGGWEPHKDRQPGKIILQRGLSRLLDMLVTQAVLSQYETTHHGLPPQITTFLSNWGPPHEL